MAYLPLCSSQVQVHVDLTAYCLTCSNVVVLEESHCLRESSRTNFQVLVLVLVLESQVLDNNTGAVQSPLKVRTIASWSPGWLGGTIGSASDQQSEGCGFEAY